MRRRGDDRPVDPVSHHRVALYPLPPLPPSCLNQVLTELKERPTHLCPAVALPTSRRLTNDEQLRSACR
jgi:hypothetical protein